MEVEYLYYEGHPTGYTMDFYKKYGSSESRREELIRKIEAAVNNLTLEELEALHYDMMTKNYIND